MIAKATAGLDSAPSPRDRLAANDGLNHFRLLDQRQRITIFCIQFANFNELVDILDEFVELVTGVIDIIFANQL